MMLDNILVMSRGKKKPFQKTYKGTFPTHPNCGHVKNDQTGFPTECQFVKWNRLKIAGYFTQT